MNDRLCVVFVYERLGARNVTCKAHAGTWGLTPKINILSEIYNSTK